MAAAGLRPRGYWEPLFEPALCAAVYLASPRARTAIERFRTFDEIETLGYAPAIVGLCVMIARLARELTGRIWYARTSGQPDWRKNILSLDGEERLRVMLREGLRGTDWVKAQMILEDELGEKYLAGMTQADALLLLMQDCALEIEEVENLL